MSFFNELKRRNVIRVAVAYLVVSWFVLQVADVVFPALNLPEWTITLVTALLGFGFVVALVFSWAFELTPDGLKRDTGGGGSADANRKLDLVTIGAVVLVVAVTFWDQGREAPAPASSEVAETLTEGSEIVAPDLSIAVLPFANMSADAENEFFADGLSEELLNVLAQIPSLKVAGRTSSFYYKGRNEDLRVIGETLGVAHILEGSVRRQGDRVRITAQLIQASDGFHLWSDTFDRNLDDIFAIQDEISAAVATALRITLLGEEAPDEAQQPVVDAESYSRYLAARARIANRSPENVLSAIDMLHDVTRDAPDFARAHAALGVSAMLAWGNDGSLTADQAMPLAERSIQRAMELAPNDDQVLAAWGLLNQWRFRISSDYSALAESSAAYRRAIELNPENVEARYWLATDLINTEDFVEAARLLDEALSIDPLATVALAQRINLHQTQGEFDQAIELVRKGMRLFPDVRFFHQWAAIGEDSRGRPDLALLWLQELTVGSTINEPIVQSMLLTLWSELDAAPESSALLTVIDSQPSNTATDPQVFRALREGDYRGALARLDALAERDGIDDWSNSIVIAAIQSGDCERAMQLEFMSNEYQRLLEPLPQVTGTDEAPVTWVAYCMKQGGDSAAAERALRAALDYYTPRPGRFDSQYLRYSRIATLALLSETEQALSAFQSYYDAGFGTSAFLFGSIPIDQDIRLASLQELPEFQRIMAAIRARNAERLGALRSGELTLETPL